MKKILLLFVAMLSFVGAFAEEKTIEWATNADWTTSVTDQVSITSTDGITILAVKGEGASAPIVNDAVYDFRAYANNVVTISCAEGQFTKIVFTVSAQGLKRWSAETSASVGTLTPDVAAKTLTWEGEATNSVSLTVGAKATLGTDGATKAGQLAVASPIVVTMYEAPAIGDLIANANFDVESDWVTEGNVAINPSYAGTATDWTAKCGASYSGAAVLKIGSTATMNNAQVPAVNAKGEAEGGVFACAGSWADGLVQYTQEVTLPAGAYTLSFDAYEGNASVVADGMEKNLIGFIANDGTEYLAKAEAYTVGEWTNHEVKFTLLEETAGKISIGYKSKNTTSNSTPKLFIDNLVLTQGEIEYPIDFSAKVVNRNTGWTKLSADGSINNYQTDFAEFYYKYHVTGELMQQVVNVPNGTYNIEGRFNANCANWECTPVAEADGQTGYTIMTINEQTIDVAVANSKAFTAEQPYTFSCQIEVTDGQLTFKVANLQEAANWITVAIDKLELQDPNAEPEVIVWDGETVVTSMDGVVVTAIEDLNGLMITLPNAKSIEILGEDDCQYLALQNEDGSELYGIWGPTMGSGYTIDGETVTLEGFMPWEGATVAIPAGTTTLYIEDCGVFVVDGQEDIYLPTIELAAEIVDNNVYGTFAEPVALENEGVYGMNSMDREWKANYYTVEVEEGSMVTITPSDDSMCDGVMVTTGNFYYDEEFNDLPYENDITVKQEGGIGPMPFDEWGDDDDFGVDPWGPGMPGMPGFGPTIYSFYAEAGIKYYVMTNGQGTFTVSIVPGEKPADPVGSVEAPMSLNEKEEYDLDTDAALDFFAEYVYSTYTAEETGTVTLTISSAWVGDFYVGENGWYDPFIYVDGTDAEVENNDDSENNVHTATFAVEAGNTYYVQVPYIWGMGYTLTVAFEKEEENPEDAISSIKAENGNKVIFNLNGARINKMQKGINIINGKKVMVK